MKCVCGYQQGWGYDENEEWKEVNPNGENFIHSNLIISYEKEGNYHIDTRIQDVYICPKCGTLKINI